jgi:hypothetical protein
VNEPSPEDALIAEYEAKRAAARASSAAPQTPATETPVSPTIIRFGDLSWTVEQLTIARAVKVAELIGDSTWDALNPRLSMFALVGWVAVLSAEALELEPVQVLAVVHDMSYLALKGCLVE